MNLVKKSQQRQTSPKNINNFKRNALLPVSEIKKNNILVTFLVRVNVTPWRKRKYVCLKIKAKQEV